jgi:hypothetical protein
MYFKIKGAYATAKHPSPYCFLKLQMYLGLHVGHLFFENFKNNILNLKKKLKKNSRC